MYACFLMFSSLEIVDFAHLSYFRLCLSIYQVFGLWKYSRPLNLAVSKLSFVSKLQFLPSKVTCVQLTCTFKLLSTVFIYLLSIWVVKIFWASKFSCLQIIFCLQITIFAFYLCNLLNTHDCFLAYLLSFFLSFFLNFFLS